MKLSALFVTSLLAAMASSAVACGGSVSADAQTDTSAEAVRARFTSLRAPTDPDLARFYKAANKVSNQYLGVYRYNSPTTESTDPAAREKRIKEVMHRYMCGFFDESIDIAENTGTAAKKVATVLTDLDMDNNSSDASDTTLTAFKDALTQVYGNRKLDVLSGSAGGNNTAGNVMGIYDEANDEVFFFGFTNCGSDD